MRNMITKDLQFQGDVVPLDNADGTPSRVLKFIGTSNTEDRYGDSVKAEGASTGNYMRNPVFLWSHKRDLPPIGKCIYLQPQENALEFHIEFDDDPFSDSIYQKYKKGFMKAVSIGFLPLTEPEKNSPETYKASGGSNLSYDSWELLELSAVCVPANPDALMNNAPEAIDEMAKMVADLTTIVRSLLVQPPVAVPVQKGAIPHAEYPLMPEDAPWDEGEARKSLHSFALGADGKLDFNKYAKGFAYVVADKADTVDGYKLPHHMVVDGAIKTNLHGVNAAMAALNGAHGADMGLSDADKHAVWQHLAAHQKEFGKEPTPLGGPPAAEPTPDTGDKLYMDALNANIALLNANITKLLAGRKKDDEVVPDKEPYEDPFGSAGSGDKPGQEPSGQEDKDVGPHLVRCMKALKSLHGYMKSVHSAYTGSSTPPDADMEEDPTDDAPTEATPGAAAAPTGNEKLLNLQIDPEMLF